MISSSSLLLNNCSLPFLGFSAFEDSLLASYVLHSPLTQLSSRLQAELHHLHPAANHKQIEVFPWRGLRSQAIIGTEDEEAQHEVKPAPLPINKGQQNVRL